MKLLNTYIKHFTHHSVDYNAQEKLISLVRDVSLLWEYSFRRPENAAEIMQTLRQHKHPKHVDLHYTRANLNQITDYEKRLTECVAKIPHKRTDSFSFFAVTEKEVWLLFISLIAFKLSFLKDTTLSPSRLTAIRTHFYPTDTWYQKAKQIRNEAITQLKENPKIAATFSSEDLTDKEASMWLSDFIKKTILPGIQSIFAPLPEQWRIPLFETLKTVHVEMTDEAGALLRCVTDPNTRRITIKLAKGRSFSLALLTLAAAHEMGHAISSALFDVVWTKQDMVGPMWSFAGVSSPNPFDPKEEAFADLLAEALLPEQESLFWYRSHVWLPTRAVADYTYHISGATVEDVYRLFVEVGLEAFAAEETFAVINQFTSLQAQYFFGHQHAVQLKNKFGLSLQELLIVLLLSGNVQFSTIATFLEQIHK